MIVSLNQLPELRKKYKNKNIVFAGGCFDVFHPAHIRTFKKLHNYGDIVVIGIVSDKRVKERKGKNRPILNQQERQEIVDAIKYVDYTVIMPNPRKKVAFPTLTVLEKLRPNIFVSVDERWREYKKIITDMSVILKIVPRIHSTSTTSIIERILKLNTK